METEEKHIKIYIKYLVDIYVSNHPGGEYYAKKSGTYHTLNQFLVEGRITDLVEEIDSLEKKIMVVKYLYHTINNDIIKMYEKNVKFLDYNSHLKKYKRGYKINRLLKNESEYK